LLLSAWENAIPKPVPFLRLGLANVPVMLGLSKLRLRNFLLLILLKVTAQGFVSGALFSYIFAFSVAGTLCSALVMRLLFAVFVHNRPSPLVSYTGLSAAGSLANNGAQLILARHMLFGEGTRYIAPLLLFSGLITGVILGIFTQIFTERSRWFTSLP
jgi:heptaprenyl diphosphate synthase